MKEKLNDILEETNNFTLISDGWTNKGTPFSQFCCSRDRAISNVFQMCGHNLVGNELGEYCKNHH